MSYVKQITRDKTAAIHRAVAAERERDQLRAEVERLRALINTPEIADFAKAIQVEAAHQRERWGTEHDARKTRADWFWLIGYLAGKALHNPLQPGDDEAEKRLHRIVTVAAAAANWHAAEREALQHEALADAGSLTRMVDAIGCDVAPVEFIAEPDAGAEGEVMSSKKCDVSRLVQRMGIPWTCHTHTVSFQCPGWDRPEQCPEGERDQLRAEVERLHGMSAGGGSEVDRLRAICRDLDARTTRALLERNAARAKVERLREGLERVVRKDSHTEQGLIAAHALKEAADAE